MKICLVIDSLGHGGSQRVLTWMANRWARQGEDVSLITLLKEEDFFSLDARIGRTELHTKRTQPGLGRRVAANLDRLRKLRRIFKVQKPDLVISFNDRTNVTALMAARGLGIPVAVSERTDPSQGGLPAIWAKLRVRMYPKAAVVVAQTNDAAQWLNAACPGASVIVLPNPLPSVPEAGRWALAEAEPLVVSIGRLHAEKGFDVLIRAFRLCINQYPEWRLEILGEGGMRRELEKLVSDLGVTSKVSMPGAVHDVMQRLQRAGIFVLSSNVEGFPNALLEAIAVGVPSISTSCRSGPSEIIDHMRNGILVPVGDARRMAAAMTKLMGDEDLRVALASNTSDVARSLGQDLIFRRWDELVRSLINSRSCS